MFIEKTMAITIIKQLKAILIVTVFALSFFALSVDNVSAGLECPSGFGDCDCNGTCETEVLSNPENCGRCGIVCESGICVGGFCDAVVPVLGGLVPCDRDFDDDTTPWNEKEDCTICHLVILTDNVIDYLLGLVGIVAVLSLVIGGLLYVTSAGNSSLITTAKTAFRKSLYGFVVVLIVWVAVNAVMVLFGFDDPLGDGSWHKFDCDLEGAAPVINYYCGDGVVTNPNDDGIAEVCDPMELKSTFIARKIALPGNCVNGDGNCPPDCFTTIDNDCVNITDAAAWVRTIYSCSTGSCDFGCAGDPLADDIGGGCYLDSNGNTVRDTNECQKGRYVCDFTISTVICENTYNNIDYKLAGDYCLDVYDYCCERFNDWDAFDPSVFNGARIIYPGSTYSCSADGCDGHTESGAGDPNHIQSTDFVGSTPNPPYTFYYTYNCDTVCKNHGGEICIGVGLSNLNTHSCYNVRCDSGASCTSNPGNLVPVDCTAVFRYWDSHSCWDPPHVFPVGSTACICK